MRQEFRESILTRQGITEVATASLASFGVLSAAFQTALAVRPNLAHHDWIILTALAGCCILAGIFHAWPRLTITHAYTYPSCEIRVRVGDIFTEQGNIIIGFTDTFDTDASDGVIIDPRSVQGQFQQKFYADTDQLDSELDAALRDTPVATVEAATAKARGKLNRYEVGTVAVLYAGGSRYFATAYGFMRNDYRVSCSVNALWSSLTKAWESVRTHGSLDAVAIPVIGSELARVGALDRNSIVKMIALSFIASTRQEIVSRQLTIVIHPKDRRFVNLIDIDRFLRAL
ncbi:macro domain-containing protein [Streptomyces sp. NPDC059445]|uniref:macro domain-containing protein n=1 Tax=Streptomyces sp. NPDC059445 TaxID=3346832 RepID=UPI00368E5332